MNQVQAAMAETLNPLRKTFGDLTAQWQAIEADTARLCAMDLSPAAFTGEAQTLLLELQQRTAALIEQLRVSAWPGSMVAVAVDAATATQNLSRLLQLTQLPGKEYAIHRQEQEKQEQEERAREARAAAYARELEEKEAIHQRKLAGIA